MDDQDMQMVRLWVLADRLLIRRLQNIAMENLCRRREIYTWDNPQGSRHRSSVWRPSTHWIPYVYENTRINSRLRKFTFDQVKFFLDPDAFDKYPEHFPDELCYDIARWMIRRIMVHKSQAGPLTYRTRCQLVLVVPSPNYYLLPEDE